MSVQMWIGAMASFDESFLATAEASEVMGLFFVTSLYKVPTVAQLQMDQWQNMLDAPGMIKANPPFNGASPAYTKLCDGYLGFCMHVWPSSPEECFSFYYMYLEPLQVVYSLPLGAAFNDAVKDAVTEMVRIFGKMEEEANSISATIMKMYNSTRSEKIAPGTNPHHRKQQMVLFLANMLCRLYRWSDQTSQSANVFNNIHTSIQAASEFPISQQVEYRYHLGRFHLDRGEIELAVQHLYWAYTKCLPDSPNKKHILKYLIVPAIFVGCVPNQDLIESVGATEPINALLNALRQPSKASVDELEQHPWIKDMGLSHIIRNQLPIHLSRRALVRLYKLRDKPDRFYLHEVHAALHVAGLVDAEDPDYKATESQCVALINIGYLKANLFSHLSILRLKPTDALPPLLEATKVMTKELSAKDQWMSK